MTITDDSSRNISQVDMSITPRSLKIVIQLTLFFFLVSMTIATFNVYTTQKRIDSIEVEVASVAAS